MKLREAGWLVLIVFLLLLMTMACSTPGPSKRYPVPEMLDPVTEQTPEVIEP